jgi:Fe-S oxidoreductase/FAD/FMN-containing dehydrogenase
VDLTRLAARLRRSIRGEVRFDALARASNGPRTAAQEPVRGLGLTVPADEQDLLAIVELAREHAVKIKVLGAGTAAWPQAQEPALFVDLSANLRQVVSLDPDKRLVCAQAGITIEALNSHLAVYGLTLPIEICQSQSTLGGLVSTDARGLGLLERGSAVHWLDGVECLLSTGVTEFFGPFGPKATRPMSSANTGMLVSDLFSLGQQNADAIRRAWPTVEGPGPLMRWDAFVPRRPRALTADGSVNLGHLFAGAKGRLGLVQQVQMRVVEQRSAETTLIMGWTSLSSAVHALGQAQAAGACAAELFRARLEDWPIERVGGKEPAWWTCLSWSDGGRSGAISTAEFLAHRANTLNPLVHAMVQAADAKACKQWRARRLSQWWHAPVADRTLDLEVGVHRRSASDFVTQLEGWCESKGVTLQATAQAALETVQCLIRIQPATSDDSWGSDRCAALAHGLVRMVKQAGGSCELISGHGLSEQQRNHLQWGEAIAAATDRALELFDPNRLFETQPMLASSARGQPVNIVPALQSIDRCTGQSSCRSLAPDLVCPSYPLRYSDQDSPRGRARALQALVADMNSSIIGHHPQAKAVMDLCVGCKICRKSCESQVDLASVKVELRAQWHARHGWSVRDRLIAELPRYAPLVRWASALINLRNRSAALRWLSEKTLGLSAATNWPRWHRSRPALAGAQPQRVCPLGDVVLWVDTLNDLFEPVLVEQAAAVLAHAGFRVHTVAKTCCGASYFSQGDHNRARREIVATLNALSPWLQRSVPIVVIEPACKAMLVEQAPKLAPGALSDALVRAVVGLEPLLLMHAKAQRLDAWFASLRPAAAEALVQGHCHQQVSPDWEHLLALLDRIPGVRAKPLPGGCCGMAGSFGLEREHAASARAMAQYALVPAIEQAASEVIVLATGSSCRHHLASLTGRKLMHPIAFLHSALPPPVFPQD